MNCTLDRDALAAYIARQLDGHFPDGSPLAAPEVTRALPGGLERMAEIVAAIKPPLFYRDGEPWFNHLHSDQYAMLLYLLAHGLAIGGGSAEVATKLYLLNKALHGIDVFYEVRLPRVFLFMHPLGSVLGRANYSDYLIVMQQCTVGNIRGVYPTLGKGVVLCAGASVLGPAQVGDSVCFAAGSLVIGSDVPANSTVTGRGKEARFLTSREPMWQQYFRS